MSVESIGSLPETSTRGLLVGGDEEGTVELLFVFAVFLDETLDEEGTVVFLFVEGFVQKKTRKRTTIPQCLLRRASHPAPGAQKLPIPHLPLNTEWGRGPLKMGRDKGGSSKEGGRP